MISPDRVIDYALSHAGKDDHHQRSEHGESDRAGSQPWITSSVAKYAQNRPHNVTIFLTLMWYLRNKMQPKAATSIGWGLPLPAPDDGGCRFQISDSPTITQSPGARSFNCNFPIRTRTKRRVGRPTAAVIRRTCRFRPSRKMILSQQSGTVLRNRIGGFLGGKSGACSRARATQGRAARPWMTTPVLKRWSFSGVATPSTCTQYSRSCPLRGRRRRAFHSG